ncbi:MAG: hypothetical protein OXE78_09465 [Gammaproteobacteria bacterium]|nr:hypothetical protein [Gammaproteobacteria bacterium]MCY4357842.1 hypothetical protein [Gammaproteobacteria bacterium]
MQIFAIQKWLATAVVTAVCVVKTMSVEGSTNVYSGIEDLAEARKALVEGRWQEAAELGEAAGTAMGLALAAEALSIYAYYVLPEANRLELLQRAIELSEKAVQLQPSDPWVRFQLAHAVGRYAQSIPMIKALAEGYVSRSRQLAEEVLALDSEMVYALLQLGSWHIEVVLKASPLVARITYGASVNNALEHYERALKLAEADIVVYAEVGRGLLSLNRRKHGTRAKELLRQAADLEPRDAFEGIRRQFAIEKLEENR